MSEKISKTILAVAMAFVSIVANAQRVPDNDAILAATNDSSSPYYYPQLMLRYEAGDTTLTLDDYYYLYYGFPFQERYDPIEPVRGTDTILAILEKNNQPGKEDAVEIIRYAKQAMMQDPFNPSNINYMTYAYGILGDTLQEAINADRFSKILATIESSGNGTSEKSPWHVLWFNHASDLVASKNLDIKRRTVVSRSAEYVEVDKNDQGKKGYYFDFSRVYWKKPEQTPEVKKGNGFMLNGIKIR